jgi:putative tricarboxylic transport membrane protein
MRARDIQSALFWIAIGAGVAYAGYDLELGTATEPGSGFMLFWVGLIMVGLAAIVLVNALRTPKAEAPAAAPIVAPGRALPLVGVVVALVLYAYLLQWLGFIVSTILLLIFLFKAIEPQRWSVAIGGAVATAVLAYLLFSVYLGAQLPKGVLEIG